MTARRAIAAATVAAGVVALSGCSPVEKRGYLPKGVTSISKQFTDFWVSTWLWALAVGVLVWGLTFYVMIRFRRKKTDVGLPVQMQYNVPLEILYTIVPVFMVAVLFGKTVELENTMLDHHKDPDVTVNVVGKQWSWDFNYVDTKNSQNDTFQSGEHAQLTGKKGVEQTLPTLYLPVDKRTRFVLTTRDVVHSFWVPQFLQKLDMIPGQVNSFEVTPTQTGTFQGKCAELCGAYHSEMLFQVKVVTWEQYQQHLAKLRAAGNKGFLSNSLSRSGVTQDDAEKTTKKNQPQYLPPGLEPSDAVEPAKGNVEKGTK